jgi:hypothetical protein
VRKKIVDRDVSFPVHLRLVKFLKRNGAEMKVLASGVQRIQGTSKAGNAFDMCSLLTLVQVENVQNQKVTIKGHGYKSMEINLDPACLGEFAGVFARGPALVDVITEPRPHMGKYETTVVGLVPAAKAA